MSLDDGCVLCWGHLHDLGMRLCSVFLGWCNDVRHVRATDVFDAFGRRVRILYTRGFMRVVGQSLSLPQFESFMQHFRGVRL